MNIPQNLQNLTNNLISNAKQNLGESTRVALPQAWTLLQLMVAEIIQAIEANYTTLAGADKKTIAMNILSTFYDSVFTSVTLPFIPSFIQPIISKYIKSLLMLMVGATIDAMVTTFRNTGVFLKKDK